MTPKAIGQIPDSRVSVSQIADLAGVSPSAVSNWRKRFDDFPEVAGTVTGGRELFYLDAVEDWLRSTGRLRSGSWQRSVLWRVADHVRDILSADETVEFMCSVVTFLHLRDEQPKVFRDVPNSAFTRQIEKIDGAHGGQPLLDVLKRVPVETLAHSVFVMSQVPPDDRAELFEEILDNQSRFAQWRSATGVTKLVQELAIEGQSSFLDPAAGTGGFLLAAAESVGKASELRGQEISAAAWRIARQRLLIHGSESEIKWGDSLMNDAFPDAKFDVVLCDPPYGSKPKGDNLGPDARWAFGPVPKHNADFLWLQHVIHHLKPDGRGYVLLPVGSLYRKGLEGKVRQELLRRGAVEGVIALPSGSAQHSATPIALWLLRRPQDERKPQGVLLVDASGGDGHAKQTLDGELIARIAHLVREWRRERRVENEDLPAAEVEILDLVGNESNLTPARWIAPSLDTVGGEASADLQPALVRVSSAQRALEETTWDPTDWSFAEAARWTSINELTVSDIAQVIRGRQVRPEEYIPEGIRAVRTRDILDGVISDESPSFVSPAKAEEGELTKPGDVLVSPGGGKPRAAVDTIGGFLVTAPLQVLRFRSEWLDPYVAAAAISASRNRRFVQGTAYARVNLRDLELPVLPLAEARKVRGALEDLRELEARARELAEAAKAGREALINVGALE